LNYKNEPKKEFTSQQSEYIEPLSEEEKEELISRWQYRATPEGFDVITDMYMAPASLYTRELIHKNGLENDQRVIEADKEILKLSFKYVPFPLIEADIGYKPEPHWWWYFLYDIHKGEYPLDLLPDHLKDIYIENLKKLGKLT